VVLRRKRERRVEPEPETGRLLGWSSLAQFVAAPEYKYQVPVTNLSLFLSGLKNAAEQLSPAQCWERI
jgi:hypothetical protein